MNDLLTQNPIALSVLMSESLFNIEECNTNFDHSVIAPPRSSQKAQDKVIAWGGNKEKVLFIVNSSVNSYFNEKEKDAFLKTLNALKLDIQDVAVINRSNVLAFEEKIKEQFQPRSCIYCEGLNEENKETFNNIITIEGIKTLYTFSFGEMLKDNNKKRSFWNAIKNIR